MIDDVTRPTYMEVNIDSFRYNIESIRKYINDDSIKLMPVIKANAYGTHINKRLDVINDFDIVAVACVDEAIDLRKTGYKKDIFVLNQPYKSEIAKIIENNIIVGISANSFISEISKYSSDIRVHIEIDSGMGRTGIKVDDVDRFLDALPNNVKIEGIYTHLSSADTDYDYTNSQIEKFKEAVSRIKARVSDIKYIHASASNGIVNFKEAGFNLVRPGIIMYGYASAEDTLEKIDLKPVAELKSTITFLKVSQAGESIGYGRSYITSKETKIATVPIGYADGFRRTFSNGFEVIIHGKKAPIIGTVCMDSFMVDVTDIDDVKEGDTVGIWDNNIIKLEDLANKCNTINYEILSSISDRVPRKFIEKE